MNVRYFEKRPGAWHLDFRGPDGKRCRPYGGPSEAAARKEAPNIIAKAFSAGAQGAFAVTDVPPVAMLPVRQVPELSLEEAYKTALKVREQWIKSKDKKTLQQTFDCIVGSSKRLTKDSPVSILTRDFVRELRAEWLKEPGKRKGTTLSASTINHRLSMLSVLLEVADLPPHTVKHLSTKGNRRKRRVFDAEVQRMQDWLLEHAMDRRGASSMSDLITLGIETGAREGELLALQWPDVADGLVTFRDTKNYETRTVPLTPRAATVLERRRGLAAPFADLDQDRVTDLWDQARRGIGLAGDTQFVFHALRHEFASRLADKGVNAFVIMALMGHTDITTTQVYVKASLGSMAEALGATQPRQNRSASTDDPQVTTDALQG